MTAEATTRTGPGRQTTGCDQLSFNPSLYAQPTTTETDSASGLDVDLTRSAARQPDDTLTVGDPKGLGDPAGGDLDQPQRRRRQDRLAPTPRPKFGTHDAAQCPEFAKVGSVTIDSSALPGPLPGFVYLGEPMPGNRYRVILIADGFATHVKLAGTVTPDPQTGQLTISFADLPQSPLRRSTCTSSAPSAGLLATPTQCGTYPVDSDLHAVGLEARAADVDPVLHAQPGPDGAPCPGAHASLLARLDVASAGNTAGAHAPSRSN